LETTSPIRTFTSYEIAGHANLLASYTCTPLVKIPTEELKPGAKMPELGLTDEQANAVAAYLIGLK